ncbi:MAG: hypothetical protein OWT27_02860, partial [Firmicutes bacterium]|nr:hypothetical protein [Bacillota bacterium]
MRKEGESTTGTVAALSAGRVFDQLMVRVPVLPIDAYHALLHPDTREEFSSLRSALLAFFSEHPVAVEAVAVASASLRTALETLGSTAQETKKTRK